MKAGKKDTVNSIVRYRALSTKASDMSVCLSEKGDALRPKVYEFHNGFIVCGPPVRVPTKRGNVTVPPVLGLTAGRMLAEPPDKRKTDWRRGSGCN
jgi:hypothetical protein